MRIGLVTADFYPNVGGVAAHVVELGRALAKAGHEVHVVTLPLLDETAARSELDGMIVHRPSIPKAKPFYSWLLARWLRKFLKHTPLDLLHVHGIRPLEASRSLGLPVVFTNHTSGFLKRVEKGGRHHMSMKRRLEHVRHVLTPSQELADATRTVGYAGPVTFIPNGVDPDRFTPGEPDADRRERWGAAEGDVVVLLARRLVEKNGVVYFAQAITKLTSENVRVVFAGDGAERAKVEQIIRDAGRLDRCTFLGNVSNTEMPEIYRAADLSVLPSLMEAVSITGLESMSTGLPLVGTNVGGIPVLIDHGKTGLLVEPRDPAALAGAMDQLIADAQTRSDMGRLARQRIVDRFSWAQIARETADVYAQAQPDGAGAP